MDTSTGIRGTDAPFVGLSLHVVDGVDVFEEYIESEEAALRSQFDAMNGKSDIIRGTKTRIALRSMSGYLLSGYSWDGIDRYYFPYPNESRVLVVGLGVKQPVDFSYLDLLETFEFLRFRLTE